MISRCFESILEVSSHTSLSRFFAPFTPERKVADAFVFRLAQQSPRFSLETVEDLYALIRHIDGVSLFICCMNGPRS